MDINATGPGAMTLAEAATAGPNDFRQLLDRSRFQDELALGTLLQHCRAYLLEIARGEMPAELTARVAPSDLVQETFAEAIHAFEHFRGGTEADLLAWLRKVLLNNIADARRYHLLAQKRNPARVVSLDRSSVGEPLVNCLAEPISSPSSILRGRESSAELLEAIDRLPAIYRLVIRLRHFDGLSLDRIGDHLGRSPDAARKLWFRSIEKLGKLMERERRHE